MENCTIELVSNLSVLETMKIKSVQRCRTTILVCISFSVVFLFGGCREVVNKKEGLLDKNFKLQLPNDENLELIWVEPGSFAMGSSPNEPGYDIEEIQHQVTLLSGYWLGKYEVTQGQWKSIMNTSIEEQFKIAGRGTVVGDAPNEPIYFVSWEDAMEFCQKLTEQERIAGRLPNGFEYALPTEAQWEYACRAGTQTATSGGDLTLSGDLARAPEMDKQAWYYENCAIPNGDKTWSGTWKPKEQGRAIEVTIDKGGVHPVGEKQANAWGFHDMHGNVWEMCFDWFGDYPTANIKDPIGPNNGAIRVKRGGSWAHPAISCRSANRSGVKPGFRIDVTGFRLALSTKNNFN